MKIQKNFLTAFLTLFDSRPPGIATAFFEKQVIRGAHYRLFWPHSKYENTYNAVSKLFSRFSPSFSKKIVKGVHIIIKTAGDLLTSTKPKSVGLLASHR